ncbi:YhcG family protein [Sebaldella sp. S0638]|uniref:PDDEXK nuclease domain-containing protein n=1 Tax=Sebaldella sp. S0638 TaxID=2957809 RepID=UPI00209DCE2C|nr:PDDEXK nuclease domain-containing protein [Sebaldella sp. S0638]MCP1224625.1 PDDEXK nuclease domain-containing protein [Sebaldella sp. S0638]
MKLENQKFYKEVVDLLNDARNKVKRTVDSVMTYTYYEVGRRIVEEEQKGRERAEYGKQLLENLSKILTKEFGKGFSFTNLTQMRKFYLIYSKLSILQTVSEELGNDGKILGVYKFRLTWSHYIFLMRLEENERSFYEIESDKNNWSLRELKRQYNTGLYERLIISKNKDKVETLAKKGQIVEKPEDLIKDPYILDFLGLEENSLYTESNLEHKVIDKLEHFLLELGKGFLFSGRQERFSFDEKHFYVDLVFYNRLLKCFVLIDLKIGGLKHEDIGQMQMYVNYYDRKIKNEDENKTIGIILCKDKSESIVEMTLPEENTQIFASKYQLILPSKEELKKIMED